ncbi:hypothetical protein [Candidatus Neptunochlamydia vexilliferae]|uniref:hypothetical protein n=1 Tax=Candidatus Neptunichlamydia vexilliferae TaxID=1651774 RepID=UPI001891DB20|nr:hypothetical protein [Candidatus Neptunochlamydia vexilliferae]
MKKFLIIFFGLVVIACLVGVLLWNMLPTIVSHKLSKRAQVAVTISDIKVSSASLSVDGIQVGNPRGYNKTPRALSVAKIDISIPLTRFFDKNIVIEDMTMDDIYLGLEFDSPRSRKGNWTTIMNNMSRATSEEKAQAAAKKETTKVLIKRLVITNLQVELAYTTGGRANRKLRPINRLELTNISSEGGIPTSQIMHIIMAETLRSVFSKEGLQNMLEGVLNPRGSSGGRNRVDLRGLFSENERGELEEAL